MAAKYPKVKVKGKQITLTKKDLKGSGGEGTVFVKGKTAYKIYHDPTRMIAAGKIDELSVLTNPAILIPQEIIFNRKKPIGYTMQFVDDTYVLCQLFTKAFKKRNNITPDMSLALMRDIQNKIQHIHNHGVLIVDLNELNFLVESKFKKVYFIDVDSYQTKNYPATAIMESIRDRHTPRGSFNEGTDWFSFAVIALQLLIGIHPYKGKHPKIKEFDDRMQEDISVFNKDVRIPGCCYPIKTIPDSYRRWFEAVLERGERIPPPLDLAQSIVLKPVTLRISGSDNFVMQEIYECKWEIIDYIKHLKEECFIGQEELCYNRQTYVDIKSPCHIGFYGATPIAAWLNSDKRLTLFNVKLKKDIACLPMKVDKLVDYDGRFYIKIGEHIQELKFVGSEFNPKVTTQTVANVLERATQVFPGVVIQNLLGSCFVSVFPKENNHYQYQIKVLNGYRIVDAKFERDVLMVVGVNKKGKYDRFVFYLDSDNTTSIVTRKIKDVAYTGLNFVVKDNGICVCINEQDEVELFHKTNVLKVKLVKDPIIHGGMHLFTDGAKILYADGEKLFSFEMK
jgi:serine/threonine protein kinase